MTIVSVVYQSSRGHTRALADAVARGAASVAGTEVRLVEIRGEQVLNGRWNHEETMAQLAQSDAIVFGCPTYMGSVSAIYKAFLEKAFDPWLQQQWKDKIAAGFTNSASQSGDKLSSLIQLSIFAAQMGMIWVGVGDPPGNNWSGGTANDVNRLGTWLGAMGQSNGDQGPELAPSQGDRITAERLGARVAGITQRWMGAGAYKTERLKAR
ncbi:FMN reductase [Edaphobacter acidisoli]|uniref:FMN reductase n=1 Tax=Edaphobacter acidisoli TaxID=2040573 RepID=A0A916RYE6_9BACT|nr:flavodoxin family protein [Edaphobacter acidisoli]GGA72318.1 FMN reductase [Edaphobacter acidisoli]